MTQPESQPQWAWVARIRRPQGRKGEVFADILTDFPEKFAERRQLWLIADPDAPPPPPKPASAKGTGLGGAFQARQNPKPLPPAPPPAKLPRQAALLDHWMHKGGIVLHFTESQSISDAEALTGLVVAVPAEQRATLSLDEYYIGDLVGCTVFDVAGGLGSAPQPVGIIEEVDRGAGPVALLVVRPSGSTDEVLIPFAKSYLRTIDIDAKRVEMALPEGLLELNQTQSNPAP
jgi:16S rRNA processing protein RimM